MSIPFEGVRRRIERAVSHRNTIAQEWAGFIEDDPYSPILDMDSDGTGSLYIATEYFPLPAVFSLNIGELLYQLRASLDGIIYEAAVIESGQNPPPDEKRLEFPVCRNSREFNDAAWKIAPLSQGLREIVEAIQPYNREKVGIDDPVFDFNRAIGILNDWARKDRHRQLHVVGSWASSANPQFRLPSGVTLAALTVARDCHLKDKTQIATFRLDGFVPGMKIYANPDLAIDIALDEAPAPCADNDTLGNRLATMIRAVDAIQRTVAKELGIGPYPVIAV